MIIELTCDYCGEPLPQSDSSRNIKVEFGVLKIFVLDCVSEKCRERSSEALLEAQYNKGYEDAKRDFKDI